MGCGFGCGCFILNLKSVGLIFEWGVVEWGVVEGGLRFLKILKVKR